jgi:hypothetical protein
LDALSDNPDCVDCGTCRNPNEIGERDYSTADLPRKI